MDVSFFIEKSKQLEICLQEMQQRIHRFEVTKTQLEEDISMYGCSASEFHLQMKKSRKNIKVSLDTYTIILVLW